MQDGDEEELSTGLRVGLSRGHRAKVGPLLTSTGLRVQLSRGHGAKVGPLINQHRSQSPAV